MLKRDPGTSDAERHIKSSSRKSQSKTSRRRLHILMMRPTLAVIQGTGRRVGARMPPSSSSSLALLSDRRRGSEEKRRKDKSEKTFKETRVNVG
ncbi:hypothetical protein E2C01_030839 [Portunus trituberculatus]|uniref:Uncharacterized protein n=1 Tax=Portunus trituberculatus TaxID=210409 RepID=A0A5B7EV99_PORTR|nr:hypothetical protein [Portunus trituberculatus]